MNKKQLNLNVMKILMERGLINQINASLVSETAVEVQKSDLNQMKCYKDVNQSENHRLSAQIVFEYLSRHNMTETLKCINSEMPTLFKPENMDYKAQLGIKEKEDLLHHSISNYFKDEENIKNNFHENLLYDIQSRLQNLEASDNNNSNNVRQLDFNNIKGSLRNGPNSTYPQKNPLGPGDGALPPIITTSVNDDQLLNEMQKKKKKKKHSSKSHKHRKDESDDFLKQQNEKKPRVSEFNEDFDIDD